MPPSPGVGQCFCLSICLSALTSHVLVYGSMQSREVVQTVNRTLLSDRAAKRPRGRGGNLFFSAYVGSDPASTVHPKKKKYQEFQTPQINI